jgi:threonine dehydrogenase-like Zn-dependent dehydrogenase
MTELSRAAVLRAPRTLAVETFPIPTIGDEDGLLEVEACGICGTDYEQYCGDVTPDAFRTPFPAIPGHEPVGLVRSLGATAAQRWGVRVGDRVAVRPVYGCGRCDACVRGLAQDCATRGGTYGLTDVAVAPSLWGGYADAMYLHPLSTIVRVPGTIPAAVATLINPLACGISWAVQVPSTRPDDRVLVLGCGQRGLSCVIAAREAGVESIVVTGLGKDAKKLQLARELGASDTIVVDAPGTDLRDEILRRLGKPSVVVDTTPLALDAFSIALQVADQRGRIVTAGIKGRRVAPDVFQDDITVKQLTIYGVSATSAADFVAGAALLEAHYDAVARMHTLSFGLADVERAVLIAAGRGGVTDAVHVAVEPSLDRGASAGPGAP